VLNDVLCVCVFVEYERQLADEDAVAAAAEVERMLWQYPPPELCYTEQ
jgi:hypothetical protein